MPENIPPQQQASAKRGLFAPVAVVAVVLVAAIAAWWQMPVDCRQYDFSDSVAWSNDAMLSEKKAACEKHRGCTAVSYRHVADASIIDGDYTEWRCVNPTEAEEIANGVMPINQPEGFSGSQPDSFVRIEPVIHAAFILTWNGTVIYNDPVGAPELYMGKPAADIVLVSDIHGDHMSVPTLLKVVGPDTKLVAPQAVIDQLPEPLKSRAMQLVNGSSLDLESGSGPSRKGITVFAIPMYNLPEAADSRHVKGRGNGYLLDLAGDRVYIAGDTAGIPEMRALTDIDIALVPMNGPTMPVEEAANAVLEFAPRKVMPYHYRSGTALSDVAKFKQLVNAGGKDIIVEQLDWYPAAPESLLQGEWTWVSSALKDNVTVTPKQADAFTIGFGADGGFSGGTDCNSYFGQFTANDGVFALTGPIGATKKFCEGSQESVYWGQLENVDSFASAFNGNLTLTLKDGGGTMTFKR